MLVAACSTPLEETATIGSASTAPTHASSTTLEPVPTTSRSTITTVDRGDLAFWDVVTVQIDQRSLLLALADDPEERSQGLMGVEDLGGLDGMLFVFPTDTNGAFWMKDTLIALDIAFFDGDGLLVEALTMEPCVADPCPRYHPNGIYRWAVEAPAGGLSDLGGQARLTIP